jgi:hypothetical protein
MTPSMSPVRITLSKGTLASAALLAGVVLAAIAAASGRDHPFVGVGDRPPSSAAAVVEPPSDPPPAAPAHATTAPVTGTVVETMDASSYTYVRLKTARGEQWAAVPQTKLAVGDRVTIVDPMMIDDFASPTLKRSFDHIVFGTLAGSSAAASVPSGPTGSPHAGAPAMGGTPRPEPPREPVARATGPDAHTIAEVFASKSALSDHPVTVRGRVTKSNPEIMGKNWLHLDDGSVAGGGDLAVTTADAAEVGDLVVVRGTVHTHRDFGAGYSYDVIVEDAKLTHE